jgi:glycyl-tRNA synthetase beta chain
MEFPSLQGRMGEIYARLDGHPEDICQAISDHYLPLQAESEIAKTMIGSIVGISDRMDTIVGCFAVGLEPTGTADPYALRRHAIAIIRLVRDHMLSLHVPHLVTKSATILAQRLSFDRGLVEEKVLNFIKNRFRNILLSTGISQEVIESVITLDFSYLHQIDRKIEALMSFRESFAEFETLATAFKRISNITKGFTASGGINPEIFKDTSERELWLSFQAVAEHVKEKIDQENYLDALNLLGQLSGPVDTFFSEVMVMATDEKVKENRLRLLSQLRECFLQVADFSKFAI